MSREIYDIKYDIDNAKIYGEETFVLGEESTHNPSNKPVSTTMNVQYEDVKTATWNASPKSGVTVRAAIPLIVDGKVVVSDEIAEGFKWGETVTKATAKDVETTVSIPPLSEGTVTLVTKRGTCDVPFTYKQKDIRDDGSTVITEHRGVFTGTNLYSTQFNKSV